MQQPQVTQQISSTATWLVPSQGAYHVVGEQTSVTLKTVTLNRGTVGNPAQEPGHNRYYGETTQAYVEGATLPNDVTIQIPDDGRQDANPTFAQDTVIENPVTVPAFGQSYTWTLKIHVAGTNANSQPYPNEPYFDSQVPPQIEGYWKTNLGTVATSPALAQNTIRPHARSLTGRLPIYFGKGGPNQYQPPYVPNNYLPGSFSLPSAASPVPRGNTSWTDPYQALWSGADILFYQEFPQIVSQNQLHCVMVPDSILTHYSQNLNKSFNIFVWDPVQLVYVNNNSFWTTGGSITLPWINNNGYSSETFTVYYNNSGSTQDGDPSTSIAKYKIRMI